MVSHCLGAGHGKQGLATNITVGSRGAAGANSPLYSSFRRSEWHIFMVATMVNLNGNVSGRLIKNRIKIKVETMFPQYQKESSVS